MGNIRTYNVSELRRIVKESINEFEPKLGKNVRSDNKKINDKAYKDANSVASEYEGGISKSNKKSSLYPQNDRKGMHNLKYDNINDSFKERVKSQMRGYTSAQNEKLHKKENSGNAEYNDIDGMKEHAEELRKNDILSKTIGLTSREIDKKKFEELNQDVFSENKVYKLTFKNTVFLSEGHMKTRIPDDFKVEGRKFIMRDKENNEYLVEWHCEDEPKIINETKIINDNKRIKNLFDYKGEDSKTTNRGRVNENAAFNDMIKKARLLTKK